MPGSVRKATKKMEQAAKTTVGMAGDVVGTAAYKAGDVVSNAAHRASGAAKATAGKAQGAIKDVHGPSPNPATNLVIADIALRGGGRLFKHLVERSILGAKYDRERARQIVKGRSMTQSLLGTAVARIATRSVPGALLVGGGLIAKTLYDRSKSRREAEKEGEATLAKQADKA